MEPTPYNLMMVEGNARLGHPYGSADDLVISSVSSDGKKVPKKRGRSCHHVVPYSKLRDFWNKLVENNIIASQEFLRVLRQNLDRRQYVDLLEPRGNLGGNDAREIVNLARDIYTGAVCHAKEARNRPPGWDNLVLVYSWLPGNLFVGPSDRCDDRGDEFDQAFFGLGGATKNRVSILTAANTMILAYLKQGASNKSGFEAAEALSGVVRLPRFIDFNGKDWIWYPEGDSRKSRIKDIDGPQAMGNS
ncbi:hypothetical protein [Frankia sp. R82]|uniref:hypothetical protein n=1 Tax=Frankia sp. R82 TaxID=2950553 RepID=UPI002043804E|nr:hypothetical protein [Frankia sp. R82]MCM3887646.1 hypothetical protein [Frankia sp. R82]